MIVVPFMRLGRNHAPANAHSSRQGGRGGSDQYGHHRREQHDPAGRRSTNIAILKRDVGPEDAQSQRPDRRGRTVTRAANGTGRLAAARSVTPRAAGAVR